MVRHQECPRSSSTVREQRPQPLLPRPDRSQLRRVAAGIDQDDGRRPRDSTLSLRSWPPSSCLSSSSALLPPSARLVPPAGCHSGCQDPAVSAFDLPCKCVGWDLGTTRHLGACHDSTHPRY